MGKHYRVEHHPLRVDTNTLSCAVIGQFCHMTKMQLATHTTYVHVITLIDTSIDNSYTCTVHAITLIDTNTDNSYAYTVHVITLLDTSFDNSYTCTVHAYTH